MANTADLPDAGKTISGGPDGTGGIATETVGREISDAEFYSKQIDERITKISPMSSPVDQISRQAESLPSDSFIVKYYSVGTRPIVTKTTQRIEKQSTGASTVLHVEDPSMFTVDDTIRVVGVKGIGIGKTEYASGELKPDLVLCVCGIDETTSMPVVYAVNGHKDNALQDSIWLPAIESGTKLVRMGKACGELDVQTGRFANVPTAEEQYCQNFMLQIEQSTFDKIAAKEVNWQFSDLEEAAIQDMRITQENSYLFGEKHVIKHPKKGMNTWFTRGIWWMAGKDIEIGSYDTQKKATIISDDNLVDVAKDLFVGTGLGGKRKVVFAGSDLVSALSKIKSDKFIYKDTVEKWSLKFKSWDTDFGELLVMHHELFDINGMSDCGFVLDPEYLTKRTHLSWARNVLDLKSAGVRNTDAVVLQEVACLYLRYAKAHARIKLKGAA